MPAPSRAAAAGTVWVEKLRGYCTKLLWRVYSNPCHLFLEKLEFELRERDLSPFGFLRLDMRPAHAVWTPPGSWVVAVLLGYQNTWVLSPNVEQYLKWLPGRRRLGPADVAAIRALPGEDYLVDLELGLIDVTLHRRLTDHWSVNAIVSGVNYSGGFLDGTIEDFHKAFGSAPSAGLRSPATASTSSSTSKAGGGRF